MKVFYRLLAILLVTAAIMPAFAQTNEYDILGLKTGMTSEQAKAAIVAKFGPTILKSIKLQKQAGIIPGHSFVSFVAVNTGHFNLVTSFVEVPPTLHQGNESAYAITYIPVLLTDADRLAFKKGAIAKYGPPVEPAQVREDDVWQDFLWCARNPNLKPYAQCNSALNGGAPVLALSSQITGWGISLKEVSIYDHMRAALEASRTRATPLL